MRELFTDCAKALLNEVDATIVYDALAGKFNEDLFPEGLINALYALYINTKNSKLLIDITDIIETHWANADFAYTFYYKYFEQTAPDMFKKLCKSYANANGKFIEPEENIHKKLEDNPKVDDLVNRFIMFIYMISYAFKNEEYELMYDLYDSMQIIKDRINTAIKKYGITNISEDELFVNDEKYLSEVLSQKEHHNDINKLAITLYKKNKKAYMNIIDDYITYNKEQDAIDFYNNEYCSVFEKESKLTNISELYWKISYYYCNIYDFYKNLSYEKKALECDLEKSV